MTQFAISALDGRYARQTEKLAPIMSEYGLMRYRLIVMCEWLNFLGQKAIAEYSDEVDSNSFTAIYEGYDENAYKRIKEIEVTTNHDVKAVEYYIRECVPQSVWPWIHICCTSEDVNNVAYALMLNDAEELCMNVFQEMFETIQEQSQEWKAIPMLARTHGQPATPTTLGKEFAVFAHRVGTILESWSNVPLTAKWNGATGNFAAHQIAFPEEDWVALSREFVNRFPFGGMEWKPLTTQIESHDAQAQYLNEFSRMCTVLIDLCSDVWGYISNEYLGLKVVKAETGSSTMPGKVNPMDFENARGNFIMARGIARTLADNLPISTWQRDLTDSTLQRNLGSVFGHFLVAVNALHKGLKKLQVREDVLLADLERHPEVLGEAIQTVMRKCGYADAYERIKELLRGNSPTLDEIRVFIQGLTLPDVEKDKLLTLTPAMYVGLSAKLVEYINK